LSLDKPAHLRAEPLDDADWLVADCQALRYWIFATQDMDVGATDRGGGNANEGIQRPDFRDGLVTEHNSVFLDENCSFHGGHGDPS
jgi:hypothetical protein